MQDLVRDWRRWTLAERVIAVILALSLLTVPVLLTLMRHLVAS